MRSQVDSLLEQKGRCLEEIIMTPPLFQYSFKAVKTCTHFQGFH